MNDHRLKPVVSIRSEPLGFHRLKAVVSSRMKNGRHTIEARAFDGSLNSDTASVEIQVANPGPSVSSGGNPWCLTAVVIAIVADLSVMLLLRKKKGKSG